MPWGSVQEFIVFYFDFPNELLYNELLHQVQFAGLIFEQFARSVSKIFMWDFNCFHK